MCWVVNGLRLKGDRQKSFDALRLKRTVRAGPLTLVVPTESCLLLRKWENSQRLVLFEFGEIEQEGDAIRFGLPVLWAAQPGSPEGQAALMPVFRERFLHAMTRAGDLVGINCGKNAPPAVRVFRAW
jgi:hypothetical protein